MWHGEPPWQAIEESTYLLDTALNKDGEIGICRAQFIPQICGIFWTLTTPERGRSMGLLSSNYRKAQVQELQNTGGPQVAKL